MKLNLMFCSGVPLAGYLNLCPFVAQNVENVVNCDIRNLDQICENAEVTELIAHNVLEYISPNELDSVFNNWVLKLRHKGIIKLAVLDAEQVCHRFLSKKMELNQFNSIVFGEQRSPFELRRNVLTPTALCQKMQSLGLKIVSKQLQDVVFLVEGERS